MNFSLAVLVKVGEALKKGQIEFSSFSSNAILILFRHNNIYLNL